MILERPFLIANHSKRMSTYCTPHAHKMYFPPFIKLRFSAPLSASALDGKKPGRILTEKRCLFNRQSCNYILFSSAKKRPGPGRKVVNIVVDKLLLNLLGEPKDGCHYCKGHKTVKSMAKSQGLIHRLSTKNRSGNVPIIPAFSVL
jgi:hypothetical protein